MNPEMFQCPICQDTLLDPRTLSCGHNYCGQMNGLDKPCIDYLLKGQIIICAMDKKQFPGLKLSEIRTNIALRDMIEDYKQNKKNKCPIHVNNNLDLVCLTCGGKRICTSCFLREHHGHDMTSAADHFQEKMAKIDNEVDENTHWLKERLAIINKVLEKLNLLTENLGRDREEISRSIEKLRSLKAQSRQILEKAQHGLLVDWSGEVDTFLKTDRSVNLTDGLNSPNVEKTCREVVHLFTHTQSSPKSTKKPGKILSWFRWLGFVVLLMAWFVGAIDGSDTSTQKPGSSLSWFRWLGFVALLMAWFVGAILIPQLSTQLSSDTSAEHLIRPQVTSAREVARVKDAKCYSIACVDDLIVVSTHDHHIIKYRWEKSGGKISINEVKRSATIENGYWIQLAAAMTQNRVRLYVCNNVKSTVERFDPDSPKQLNKINTDNLDSGYIWCIAAWGDMLVVSDCRVIAMYKNDQLVCTVPYEHVVLGIRLSSTFLATMNRYYRLHVMRWDGDRLDITPVYTIESICWGLAMSERMLVTVNVDQGKEMLVTLDLTTGEERQLEYNVGRFLPYAFARDDLIVGRDLNTLELTMMQLS